MKIKISCNRYITMKEIRTYLHVLILSIISVFCSEDSEAIFKDLDEFHASNLNSDTYTI